MNHDHLANLIEHSRITIQKCFSKIENIEKEIMNLIENYKIISEVLNEINNKNQMIIKKISLLESFLEVEQSDCDKHIEECAVCKGKEWIISPHFNKVPCNFCQVVESLND